MRRIVTILVLAGVVLFAAPAAYMVETQTGPAAWLIAQQLLLFGGYFRISTMAVVMLMELSAVGGLVLVVALVVKRLTGRTLVELVRGQRRRPEAP